LATDSAVENGVFSIPLKAGAPPRSVRPIGAATNPNSAASQSQGQQRRSRNSNESSSNSGMLFELAERPAAPLNGPGPLPEFIAGRENAELAVAVEAVFSRRLAYSPLCLYGPSGCGKTHLTTGLIQRVPLAGNGAGMMRTGADFARELIHAFQTDSLDEFRRRLGELSLFVLDNLEELAGKHHAQQELCGLIDQSRERGPFVVATCKGAPLDLATVSSALKSRLSGGLSLPVRSPTSTTRRMILARLAEHWEIPLSDNEIIQLADSAENQPPTYLQTLLIQYRHFADTSPAGRTTGAIDSRLSLVARFLEHHNSQSQLPAIKQIASQTAKSFKVTQRDLCGPTRRQAVVKARGVAMYVVRKIRGDSLEAIGGYFGNRDHTTVLHACRKTESLIGTDPIISEAVEQLLKKWS
jgi:chromosomal replication initiator protein